MTGRHRYDQDTDKQHFDEEMDEYLDLYGPAEQIDGSKVLPARGGRHARREQQ